MEAATHPHDTNKNAPVLTVSQLTQAIKTQLETQFGMLRLQGEISNFKRQSSGHLYFSLKDQNAQVSAVMFRGDASRLQAIPKDGDQVIVRGELSVYAPRGNYQLIVRELAYAGVGELLLRLEQLKVKLHRMGWFKQERKKPLPKAPRRIGIITSPTGAAIRDILNVLTRRHSGLEIILNPVKVQGEGAAQEIAQAIMQFNQFQMADVLIVGRGGGSIEDLWAFNEEIVAQAIYQSQIPIIGAVGHETDHCIAEYVADVRAPTPSAAAEIVTKEKAQMQEDLHQVQRRIQQTIMHLIGHARQRIQGIERHPAFASPYALLGPYLQRLDELKQGIDLATGQQIQTLKLRLEAAKRQTAALQPLRQIEQMKQKLSQIDRSLQQSTQSRLTLQREKLTAITSHLQAIDPRQLLKKGYTILFNEKDHSVITSCHSLRPEQKVQLQFADGTANATIDQVTPNE